MTKEYNLFKTTVGIWIDGIQIVQTSLSAEWSRMIWYLNSLANYLTETILLQEL